MAAGDSGGGDFEVGTWKLIVFFLLILVVDTTWEFIDERVTHGIRRRRKKGLMHAWEQIKFEIMALGLVSLLLVVFEEYLLNICVNKSKETGDSFSADDSDDTSRRLLAASGGDSCAEGKEPLWSSALIHKVHILIFLIAVSHVVYALMSLGISMLSMRRFHKFEKVAQEGKLLGLPTDQLQRDGEGRITFGIRQAVRQFTHPIDMATYIALRRLFIEAVQVDPTYDFASFVSEYLAEEFSHVVRLEFLMWVIAIVWIAFPAEAYAGIWLTAIFCTLSVTAGAKLHVIAMHLARQAYSLYYLGDDDDDDENDEGKNIHSKSDDASGDSSSTPEIATGTRNLLAAPRESRIIYRPSAAMQLTEGSVGMSTWSKDDVKSLASQGPQTHGSAEKEDTPVSGPSGSGSSGGHVHRSSAEEIEGKTASAADVVDASFHTAPSTEAVAHPQASPSSVHGKGSSWKMAQAVAEGASNDDSDSIGLPIPAANMRAYSPQLNASAAVAAADTRQWHSRSPRPAVQGTSAQIATAEGVQSLDAVELQSSSAGHPSPAKLSSPSPAARPENSPRSPHSSFGERQGVSPSASSVASSREFCATCMRCGRAEKQRSPRKVKKWVQMQEYKGLFWFKRPRLMLRIFQYAYFENALSLAVLVFAFWQNESTMIGGGIGAKKPDETTTGSIVAGVLLLALDLMLLIHSSYFVLPVHALTSAAVNFGSQYKVLQAARQYQVRPDIINELEETGYAEHAGQDISMCPQQESLHLPPAGIRIFALAYGFESNRGMNNTPHLQSPILAQGVGASAPAGAAGSAGFNGLGPPDTLTSTATAIAPAFKVDFQEGPVRVFNSENISIATATSSPESPGVSEPHVAPQAVARPRTALARRSAAPTFMHASPSQISAADSQTVAPPELSRDNSMELTTHTNPSDAPSVIEGLMQSMIQYRRRMDQQSVTGTRSHATLAPPPQRPRSSLARHSDVSAVMARAAAVHGDTGSAVDPTPSGTHGEGGAGTRRTGPRVFTRVLSQGGTPGGIMHKSTSAEQLSSRSPTL